MKQNKTTDFNTKKKEVLLFLKMKRREGAINQSSPILSSKLCKSLNINANNGVVLRKIVNQLRCDGHPIGSNSRGYFYASKKSELSSTIEQLTERESSIHNAVIGLVLAQRKTTKL